MSDDRRRALEHFQFEYQDEDTDILLNESKPVTPITLRPTSGIIILGYLPHHSTRFSINLTCRSVGNVAFHLNPRLDRGYIVRNSKARGVWGEEETCSPAVSVSDLFSQNSYFHLVIFCTANEFYIAVNGQHFCTFSYRLPLDSITNFEYSGDVEDVRIRDTTFWIYPDPKILKPTTNLQLSVQQPLTDNLKVPSTISLTQVLENGAKIFIKGRLKLLPHSFYVNLQKGPLLYPHPEISLHLNPRFQYGNRPSCVVMNCWTGGSWSREERHEGHLSWAPGREFLLTIRCGYDSYIIWLGNKMIGEFKHRVKSSTVDTLLINGDIVIHELALSLVSQSSSQRPSTNIHLSRASSMRAPSFLIDRRLSEAEMERRHMWLQKTRLSIASTRNRAKICYQVRFPDTLNGLYCARYSPSGDIIVTSFGSGAIQIRNGENGQIRSTMRSGIDKSFPVMCCRFNPKNENIFYASSACGNIFMCAVDTNEFSRFIEEAANEVNAIDVSVGGEYIISGGKDAALRLYDAETAKSIHIYKRNEADFIEEKVGRYHRMRIFAVKFHESYPDLMITGGWDDTVRVWDRRVDTGSTLVIKGPHICGDAIDVKETQIITGSWVVRGSLQLWDMTSGKLIDSIVPENRPTSLDGEFLYAVQYFDGDSYGEHVIAGGSGTGAVEVINLKEKKVVGSFEVHKAVLTLDSNQTSIVFGGMESIIRLADFS